jgi:hypothetical protein
MPTKPDLAPIPEELHRSVEARGYKLLRRLPDRRAIYLEHANDPAPGLSLCFRNESRLRGWLTVQAARRGKAGAA